MSNMRSVAEALGLSNGLVEVSLATLEDCLLAFSIDGEAAESS